MGGGNERGEIKERTSDDKQTNTREREKTRGRQTDRQTHSQVGRQKQSETDLGDQTGGEDDEGVREGVCNN